MQRDMKRILIVGAGAIGGTLAVHLGKICDLFVLEKDPALREIIAARGITLKDDLESRTVQPTVLSPLSEIPGLPPGNGRRGGAALPAPRRPAGLHE